MQIASRGTPPVQFERRPMRPCCAAGWLNPTAALCPPRRVQSQARDPSTLRSALRCPGAPPAVTSSQQQVGRAPQVLSLCPGHPTPSWQGLQGTAASRTARATPPCCTVLPPRLPPAAAQLKVLPAFSHPPGAAPPRHACREPRHCGLPAGGAASMRCRARHRCRPAAAAAGSACHQCGGARQHAPHHLGPGLRYVHK